MSRPAPQQNDYQNAARSFGGAAARGRRPHAPAAGPYIAGLGGNRVSVVSYDRLEF